MTKKPQIAKQSTAIPLNPAQKAAAEAKNGPLLIVAGAGTGKTKTLTSRILHMIEGGMAAERICAITFTNKAAKEMQRRVIAAKGAKGEPSIGTFHSLGARILRKECRNLGRTPNFTIFDDHDSFDLVKKATKQAFEEKGEVMARKGHEAPTFFAKKISEIKNRDEAKEELKEPSEKNALIIKIFEKYEAALQENNAFDFDDLIGKVVFLFKSHPEILKKYQGMFDAILVDEYQDINPKQHELIALLAGEHRNISVVGDDEQTIYSWRYADVRTFLGFEKEWKGARVYFLEENYRSSGNIIRAAAEVAKNNRFRAPKNLWTQNDEGTKIDLFEAWGENEEAAWIASKIKRASENQIGEDRPPSIGILYRTNAQSRAIEQALIRNNIPYRIFGGLKFYERREVKDVVAALRYVSNRKDTVAKERLEKNLTKRKFAAFRAKLESANPLAPLEAINLFLETFGYFEYLEENFMNADERQENIAELIAFAGEFERLDDLLERLSLLQAADDTKEADPGNIDVNLMTIHLAKGLEFDSVFIAGVAEGLLPHGRSLDSEDAIEEERRLMYVAMTRARKNLFISFHGMPSRFIEEIPQDSIVLTEGDIPEEDAEDFYSPEQEEKTISLD